MRKILIGFGISIVWTWFFGPRVIGQPITAADRPPIIETSRKGGGELRWAEIPGSRSQMALVRHGEQVGSYNFQTGYYHEKRGGEWSGPAVCPIDPPYERGNGLGGAQAFGVGNFDHDGRERFADGDREYTREAVEDLLTAHLRDDSRTPHITVVSRDAATAKKAESLWEQIKRSVKGAENVRFQSYDITHPVNRLMLAPNRLDIDANFARVGSVVLAQAPASEPDGRSRVQAWYEQPAPQVLLEALRKVDPNYNPNLTPGPLLPAFPPLGDFVYVVGVVLLLGVLLLVGLAFK